MAADHAALEKIGVHLDVNSLCLLDPDIAGPTNELQEELHCFVESKSLELILLLLRLFCCRKFLLTTQRTMTNQLE